LQLQQIQIRIFDTGLNGQQLNICDQAILEPRFTPAGRPSACSTSIFDRPLFVEGFDNPG
jgi:hypothetical protein